jgi:hypothetical protein
MRDLVGHDQQPAAYLIYLHLYRQAARNKWKPVSASLRTLADATGLSKSAVQDSAREIAPARINRHRQRPRDGDAASPRSSPLAQMM